MSPAELVDFLSYLHKEEQEELLFKVWANGQTGLSFEDWKKKAVKQSNTNKLKKNKSNEDEALKFASQFIKPLEEGG